MHIRLTKNKIINISLLVLIFIMCNIMNNYRTIYADSKDFSNSVSEIVMDVRTNRILFENNINEKKYMASTTKILTCICAIENSEINKEITISKDSIGVEGSSIYLEENERLTIKDLLYGLMLRSGNDCAETIAKEVSGSISNFAELMNKTAKKIGALSSNFVNPHGLHNDNHFTTAYDLALISCYAMKNDVFREICSTKKKVIPFTTRNTKRVLINKNKLLNSLDGATGIKTGFTKKAGRCLVSSCKRNGNEVVTVVLNCPPMFERSTELINYTFDKYNFCKIFESDNVVDFIDIKNSKEKCALICKDDIIIPLTNDEKEMLDYKITKTKLIDNIDSDKSLGKISFYVRNNLIFEEKIYSIISEN